MKPNFQPGVFGLLVVAATGCSSVKEASFPGKTTMLQAPRQTMVLKNVDAESEKDEVALGASHALFLLDSTGRSTRVYSYSRHIRVIWSPTDQFLAITDYDGSDHATCGVFFIQEGRFIDVESAIKQEFENRYEELSASHIYFEASSWISGGNRLAVKVRGYGYDPDGRGAFDSRYCYDLLTGRTTRDRPINTSPTATFRP